MMAEQCYRLAENIQKPKKELHARCEAQCGVEPLVKEFQHTFIVSASIPKLRGLRAFMEINNYEFEEESNANV